MDDRYLWEQSGPPDPDVERLERALAPFAHRGEPLTLLKQAAGARETQGTRTTWRLDRSLAGLTAAAAIAVAVGTWWWTSRLTGPVWEVLWLEGAKGGARYLAEGQRLVTGPGERARVQIGSVGEVTLEAGSRLRRLRAGAEDQRLALERGVLHALVLAPPRQFQVETPAATAVDLGCAYLLEVASDGRSIVTVESGWVSFERDGRESFVPEGARCVTRPGRSPGLPYFLDADPRLVAALEVLDRTDTPPAGTLAAALSAASAKDALTLWHLLARCRGGDRAAVFDRFASLRPPPEGVTREGVLRADRPMLERWWNDLGYGDVEWWRLWQQAPPDARG